MNRRVIHEASLLLWPWCLMTIAGLAPLLKLLSMEVDAGLLDDIAFLGFFGGTALLSALVFRQGQSICGPVDLSDEPTWRRRLWADKMAALLIAIISAGATVCLVQGALGTILWRDFGVERAAEPVLLGVIIVCSSGFWTLLARSVVGGMLLTGGAQLLLYLLLVVFVRAIDRMALTGPGEVRLSHVPEVHRVLMGFVAGFGLSYALIMLWLGRRRFAARKQRLQG
jgi:hypothetical protein